MLKQSNMGSLFRQENATNSIMVLFPSRVVQSQMFIHCSNQNKNVFNLFKSIKFPPSGKLDKTLELFYILPYFTLSNTFENFDTMRH